MIAGTKQASNCFISRSPGKKSNYEYLCRYRSAAGPYEAVAGRVFHLRDLAIAAESALVFVRVHEGDKKVIDSHQPAFDLWSRSRCDRDGRQTPAPTSSPSAGHQKCVLQRLGVGDPRR